MLCPDLPYTAGKRTFLQAAVNAGGIWWRVARHATLHFACPAACLGGKCLPDCSLATVNPSTVQTLLLIEFTSILTTLLGRLLIPSLCACMVAQLITPPSPGVRVLPPAVPRVVDNSSASEQAGTLVGPPEHGRVGGEVPHCP